MKNLILFCLFLLFASCSTQTSIYYAKLSPIKLKQSKSLMQDSLSLCLLFEGINQGHLAIGLEMINKTNHTIPIVPSLFYYTGVPKENCDSILPKLKYFSLDYKKEIDSLIFCMDSLNHIKNPDSDSGKSTGQIVKEGLTRGVVALLLPGISAEDLEKQREEDKDNWDSNRSESLNSINSQLLFWRTSSLKEVILFPNDTVQGSLLFPIDTTLKQIDFKIPIADKLFGFPYSQTFKR